MSVRTTHDASVQRSQPVSEWRLFDAGTIPEYATAEWYRDRESAPHLEQDGHRQRLLLTAEMVTDAVTRGATDICDLGAGDGGLLQAITEVGVTVPAWGYDLQPSNVEAANRRGVHVEYGDMLTQDVRFADCLVAAEVIEHLVDPHGFVDALARTGARWLVASSPYTETADSHYGYHLWAWDQPGYRQLLEERGWRVLRQETAWISQVLLAERAG